MTDTAPPYRPIEELVPAQWQRSEITANGIRQHVLRMGGDKPPLLMLHSFMESGVSWLRLARALAGRFEVIMPDARVHGRSEGGASGFSPEILTDDALSVVETLGLERPIVLGHSNGAVTAYLMAVQQPLPHLAANRVWRHDGQTQARRPDPDMILARTHYDEGSRRQSAR